MILREEKAKKEGNIRKRELLIEVIVKIGLERIDMQKGVIVEALLDIKVTRVVISSEFARKQGSKLKKLERLVYIRNVDGSFNKEGLIKYIVKVNIYYQRYRERTEIDIIGEQKWKVILGIPWLVYHNLEVDWRTEEVKMTRYPKKCRRKWRLKQEKLG